MANFCTAVLMGGLVLLNALGVAGMSLTLGKSLPEAAWLAIPFLAGDLVKAVLAALITQTVARMRPNALLSRA